ncbi:hypothetical protein M8C21_014936, partial [Ambrosia artemisiifolia]
LREVDLEGGIFTLRQIEAATKNFSPSNKIGEGGFGAVYKGLLWDGTAIAVKQLSPKSEQGSGEFLNEVSVLSALQHPNLVKFHGSCVQGKQLSLIYEYMENNSLSHALSGKDSAAKAKLTWIVRSKICLGIAKGLVYLHQNNIIHRDIKPSNVLLDGELNPKIADFGLAKLLSYGNISTPFHTRAVGTTIFIQHPEYCFLLQKARVYQKRGCLLELVNADLGLCPSEEALTILNVALLCTHELPDNRPTMSEALDVLEGRTNIQDLQIDRNIDMSLMNSPDHDETSKTGDESSVTESFVTESVITKLN